MSTASCDRAEAMARIRASMLRRAGLAGPYARAESELGRRVYELARSGRGAYLWGEPGTGKTYAAACAVRRWVDSGGEARLVTARRLLDAVRDGFRRDGEPGDRGLMERMRRIPLLALDELGGRPQSAWAVEELTELIDARTSAGLPTIVTSNYSLGQVRDLWGGMEGKRVASRLAGAGERIEVAGPDRRLGRG